MTQPSALNEIQELKFAASWMLETINAYEEGVLERRSTSVLAKKALKKVKSYIPKCENEKENKGTVVDLCISLSTIDRAEGNFEKFYLASLKEELEKVIKILEEE
ncbi:MAG: hypothetical protein ACXABK_00730 [Candidatus Heimdallarchaeaceae archaeon]|jgi:hypothetical protein